MVGARGRGNRPRGRGRAARRGRVQPNGITTEVEASVPSLPPAPHAARRSLSEALGVGVSRADSVLGPCADDSAWHDITASIDNFTSLLPPNPNTTATGIQPASHVADDDDLGNVHDDNLFIGESSSSELPRDDSLKYRVDVTSPHPLTWTLARSTSAECRAVNTLSTVGGAILDKEHAAAGANIDIDMEDIEIGDDAMQLFCLSLMHYQHPSSKLSTKRASSWLGDLEDVSSLSSVRVEVWQDTLRSLFYAYRQRFVPYFYVQLSTTTVRFGRSGDHNDDNNDGGLRAEFSRATDGLRTLLMEYGVIFEIHNAHTPSDPLPCVVVEGGDGNSNIQTLYNVVTTVGPTLADAKDVPVLISDWPFKGATLTSSIPGNVRDIIVERTAAHVRRRYSVEISGNSHSVFTPTQIRRLSAAIRMAQRNNAEIHLRTDNKSARLNVCGGGANGNGKSALGNKVISRIRMRENSDRPEIFTISAELQQTEQ